MAVLLILALIDIVAGVMLSASGIPNLPGNGFVVTLAVILLVKGAWFLITGLSGDRKPWEMFEGVVDLLGGLLLVMVYLGFAFSLFAIPGVLLIITGAWYLFKGLTE